MKITKRMSLKKKLIMILLALMIGNICICFYYAYNMHRVVEVNQNIQESYSNIWSISSAIHDANEQIVLYMKEGDEDALSLYYENYEFVEESVFELERSTDNIEEIFLIRAIQNASERMFYLYNLSIDAKLESIPSYYANYYKGLTISGYAYGYIEDYIGLLLEENTMQIETIQKDTQRAFWNVQMILLLFAGVYVIISVLFSRWLTRPITNMVEAAKKIGSGDYDFEDLPIISSGELGELTVAFNIMKGDIGKAIDILKERVEIEKQLREAQLKEVRNIELLKEAQYLALQSQMNPHFLFNTLNAISRSIEFETQEVAVNLVHSLATICRYNLDHFNTYSTIKEELYVTERYIFIQQHRFEERIQFFVQCDEKCEEELIPSLFIQPLVENALIHGIENKENGGEIHVRIKSTNKGVCIRVFDNGIGMSKDKTKRFNEGFAREMVGHTTGIGLGNIIQRVQLIEHSTIKIISRQNRGTLIKIYMPYH